jgi:hypothetical protein
VFVRRSANSTGHKTSNNGVNTSQPGTVASSGLEGGPFALLRRYRKTTIVVVLLFLLLGLYAFLEALGRAALNRQIAAIRAAGEPLTLEELEARHPAIPDDENMALLLSEAGPRVAAAQEGWGAPLSTAEYWTVIRMPGSVRYVPRLGARWPVKTLEAIRDFLESEAKAMALVRRAGQMARGCYSIEWTSPPVSTVLPQLRWHRSLVNALCLEAVLAMHDGRIEEAVQAIEYATRIGRTVSEDPFAISSLMAQSHDVLTLKTATAIVNLGEPGDESLARLTACAKEMVDRIDLRRSLSSERALFYETHLWLQTGGTLEQLQMPGGGSMELGPYALTRLIPGRAELDAIAGLKFHTRTLAALSKGEAVAYHEGQRIEQEYEELPKYYFVTKHLSPIYWRAIWVTNQNRMKVRAFRAALAAERYRAARGDYPEDLSTLVPDYLDAIPLDPLTDEPLRYQREPDGIIVWLSGDAPPDEDATHPLRTLRDGEKRVAIRLLNPPLRGVASVEEAADAQTEE